MSYTEVIKQVSLLGDSVSYLKKIVDRLDHKSQVAQTIKELESLSDRELRDIGIGRSQIRAVAEGRGRG